MLNILHKEDSHSLEKNCQNSWATVIFVAFLEENIFVWKNAMKKYGNNLLVHFQNNVWFHFHSIRFSSLLLI